jgi:hypothetical protein
MRKLIMILTIVTFMFSCEKSNNFPNYDNMDVTAKFDLSNPVVLSDGDCAGDPQTHTYICLYSVLNDSRCPEGAECFWEGNAKVRFKFIRSDEQPVFFNLNTNLGFTNDTIVSCYKFTLKALYPYPSLKNIILHKVYKAEIEIEKVNIK